MLYFFSRLHALPHPRAKAPHSTKSKDPPPPPFRSSTSYSSRPCPSPPDNTSRQGFCRHELLCCGRLLKLAQCHTLCREPAVLSINPAGYTLGRRKKDSHWSAHYPGQGFFFPNAGGNYTVSYFHPAPDVIRCLPPHAVRSAKSNLNTIKLREAQGGVRGRPSR